MKHHLVLIVGDVWVRPDAIEAVRPSPAGGSSIHLAGGSIVTVRSLLPREVIDRLHEARKK